MHYSEIMVRYGELSTKGKNRMRFINKLKRNIQSVLSIYPQVHVKADHDRTHIYPQGTDYQPVAESLKQIFGIQNFSPSYRVKKSVPALKRLLKNLVVRSMLPALHLLRCAAVAFLQFLITDITFIRPFSLIVIEYRRW